MWQSLSNIHSAIYGIIIIINIFKMACTTTGIQTVVMNGKSNTFEQVDRRKRENSGKAEYCRYVLQ